MIRIPADFRKIFRIHSRMHKDGEADPPRLVCTVGKTVLHYDLRCLQDLHAMLKQHGDWMELGGADEQKPAKEGTVEAWGRSPNSSTTPRTTA